MPEEGVLLVPETLRYTYGDHSSMKIWMLFEDPWYADDYVHVIYNFSSYSWLLLQLPLPLSLMQKSV